MRQPYWIWPGLRRAWRD
uniref:Uncharacterized protein n=1 Tax=Arundo donax TaxID=35708 RepID=A0A0A9CCE7_ARUDO